MGRQKQTNGPPAREKGRPADEPAGWHAIPSVRAQGSVVVPRALRETPMWQQPREFSFAEAYIDIVLQAQWRAAPHDFLAQDGRVVRVQQGECCRSYEGWAERWRMTGSKARRVLRRLGDLGYTSTRVEMGMLCVTVLDYGMYFEAKAWQDQFSAPGERGDPRTDADARGAVGLPSGERV